MDATEKKISRCLKQNKKVAIYGTGGGAAVAWEYIETTNLLKNVIAVIDRDDSPMIGQKYGNYTVKKLSDVIYHIDAIMIVSVMFWSEIEERVNQILDIYEIDIPVLSVYDPRPQKVRDNSLEDYQAYVNYIENRQQDIKMKKNFVPLTGNPYQRKEGDPRIIAYYLPQYYQMKINDDNYGKGFTEWTNSSKAIPFFVGHDQPHIPYDVGYYDLTNVATLKRQAELASLYGIYGFCFHYYWFSGIRMMEKPTEIFLNNRDIPLKFCFNWATENWTRKWDGTSYEVIFEQKWSDGDEKKLLQDLLPYFLDERYIRIDGKPLFMIYQPDVFGEKNVKPIIESIRSESLKVGLPGLYIIISNHNGLKILPENCGADALSEFHPNSLCDWKEYPVYGYRNPYFAGRIYDYEDFVMAKKYMIEYSVDCYYRSALVGFDNTARKANEGGHIFHGITPLLFKSWVKDILLESKRIHREGNNIIFINSWNEWAEGSHLEPDIRNGYAYLNAVKQAMYESRELDTEYVERCVRNVRYGMEIHFMIKCIENMGDIVACEPIVRYLKEKYEGCRVSWIVKKEFEACVKYNPCIDEVKIVSSLREADEIELTENQVMIDCHYDGRRCAVGEWTHHNMINPAINEESYFNYGGLLTNFSLTAGLPPLKEQPRFYQADYVGQKKKSINRKYAVFHCMSSEQSKNWKRPRWGEVAAFLRQRGYDTVEIGFETVILEGEENGHHNFCDERDIQLIAEIIKNADLFIGIDSGFAHIANCFMKKSLILIGKYKNFDRPMPYTGYFAGHCSETILYPAKSGEKVADIAVLDVISRLEEILDDAE